MPEFVVKFKGGEEGVVEGAGLFFRFEQGSDAALVTILDADKRYVAVFPTDAIKAVSLKEAWKEQPSRPSESTLI